MKWWIAAIAILAIGVIISSVYWGTTHAALSDMKMERDMLATELTDTESQLQETHTDLANTQAELAAAQAELAAAQAELVAAQAELAAAQAELAAAQAELAAAQAELVAAQAELAAAQAELADTEAELAAAQAELADTEAELAAAQAELADTEAELATAQAELADTEAELAAALEDAAYWESMYYSVEHPSNFDSLAELLAWLDEDETDSYTYIPDTFDCDDFALTLYEHAREDGYIIHFQVYDLNGDGNPDHALNVAIIGNNVYRIEPQTDAVQFWCYVD
jgi:septal ring factor EnvC (AmiA/AmiB activator)